MERILRFLVVGSRGGPNRTRLLQELGHRPQNAHQLAVRLGLDYRTVRYHLSVLLRERIILNPREDSYGSVYFLDPWLEANPDLLDRLHMESRGSQSRPNASRILEKGQSV